MTALSNCFHSPRESGTNHESIRRSQYDSIEEFFQIEIDHPSVALRNALLRLCHGLMRRPTRSEPIAVLGERRIPSLLQNLHHRLLDKAVQHGWDVGGTMHLMQLALGMKMGRIGDPLLQASIQFVVDGDCIWGVRLALFC
jgi:hypothetical protein